jgi:hypothetical protein
VYKQETNFLRGYAAGFSAYRKNKRSSEGIGDDLKANLSNKDLGIWGVGSHMMGETIPKESSYVALDKSQKDQWGIPLLKISVDYDDNDAKMKKDYVEQMTEMFTSAGFTNIQAHVDTRARDWISTKWAAYVWVKTLKHQCLINGIACTPAKMFTLPMAPA